MVKEEIDRLGVEYGKLGEPWRFVARLADIIAAATLC
jgi:hypothetical protein